MSYDLHVISKRKPKAADLDAFLASEGTPTSGGRLRSDGYLLLTADDADAEVDGPSRVEAEDVPDAADGAIGPSGWLLQISVKGASGVLWPMDLAIHLARAADGVVYDPQHDRVTWPKGFEPRSPTTGEIRVSQLELTWFTTWPSDDPRLPTRLIELLAERCPEALPKRYGGSEPLPYRFDGGRAVEEFVAHWVEEAVSWSALLSWTTTRPCLDASATMSTMRAPHRQRDGYPVVRVRASFDGRVLARDPAYTERVVGLFGVLATELRCIYAAGSVIRGVIERRGRTWSDNQTEWVPLPRTDRWIGLPPSPTWLAWFGAPYAELVRPRVAEHITAETDIGILVRLGAEPKDADALADLFPPLPSRLVTRRRDQPGIWLPHARYTMTVGAPSHPAQLIPEL